MTRTQARKGFFIAIGVGVTLWFPREPLSDLVEQLARWLTPRAYDPYYAGFPRAAIEDRWALASAGLTAVWFAYHYTGTAPDKADKGARK